MQRVAARLRACTSRLAIETGFLNYGVPTLAECASALAQRGVRQVSVQPYFLTTGQYVQRDLSRQTRDLRTMYPDMQCRLTPVLGEHDSMAKLLHAQLDPWRQTLVSHQTAGVVLVAHGSHFAQSVCQVQTISAQLQAACRPMPVVASYLDINRPDLATGCQRLLQQGIAHVAVLPYFLHWGRHVKEDLPRILASVSDEFPDRGVTLLGPLEDVPGISEIILSHLSSCPEPLA